MDGAELEASPDSWPSFAASAARHGNPGHEAAGPASFDSAVHVKAAARSVNEPDRMLIEITLAIDAGYHVNANPASLDYLIPTAVKIPGVPQAKVTYPHGKMFQTKFLPEGISVYEGSVTIDVELPEADRASIEPLQLDVQACTDEICLPPATLSVPLENGKP